jgi:formylglycine-generating enzyme required for sulfatase activity
MKKVLGVSIFAFASFLIVSTQDCSANAINVTNVSVSSVVGGMADIQFDISWSNSWNLSWSDDGGQTTVTNWDAAWVFLKFKTPSSGWRHGMLASSGHTAAAGASIELGSNGAGTNIGVFIKRDSLGAGSLSAQGMKLRWDFAQSSLGGTSDVDISIHAIEMVYIPKGAFALGSGGVEQYHFYKYPTSTDPYYVTNEAAISYGNTAGMLYNVDNYYWTGILSNAFPKGYAAFYCMKYEISQGQYAAFLNHLDSSDGDARYPAYTGTSRYAISVVSNQYSSSATDRACNFLSVQDLCSYLDWSGLRPMTELEFEKACRGTINPEINEYVWGTTTATKFTSLNGIDGSGSETALPTSANCNFTSVSNGPVRVGIFAQPGASRQKAGAGYYGVMDLAGNVSECVVMAYGEGKTYVPTHGDGLLYTAPDGWPTFYGFMRRGGSWSGSESLQTSYRSFSSDSTRASTYGGRGVRTSQP